MDTTKTNIKMCEKAGEIQKIFKAEKLKPSKINPILCYCYGYVVDTDSFDIAIDKDEMFTLVSAGSPFDDWHWIWLPTQSQLQEMVKSKDVESLFVSFLVEVCAGGTYEIEAGLNGAYKQFTSMEQLWLAFVMKELYSKTWDGKDWIKDGYK